MSISEKNKEMIYEYISILDGADPNKAEVGFICTGTNHSSIDQSTMK